MEGKFMQPAQNESNQTLLAVSGLSVYAADKNPLVSDVGITVRPRETLGIVGESGSGKSMTARALVGLLPAGTHATGTAQFDGLSLLDTPERELRAIRGSQISLLMQDPFGMLNPVQTVGEHVRESLQPHIRKLGRYQTRREVSKRMSEVGLDPDIAHKYPFQLSGGMRQRVAMAAALAGDPALLIADEPTTALDVTTQDEILGLLASLQHSRNMALILITHDLRVAMNVCDRVQVMYAGRVVEEAGVTDLATAPAHPYTRGLMLANPPVERRLAQLISIPGSVPRAATVADMCAFADRCAWSAEECRSSRPPLVPIVTDHFSACARIDQIGHNLTEAPDVALANEAPNYQRSSSTEASVIEMVDVHKIYRTKSMFGRTKESRALRGVSFSMESGESVGLVGESGSGKTTIARALLGLEQTQSGYVAVCGKELSSNGFLSRQTRLELARQVQVVFQDPYASLNPARTVGAAILEAMAVRRDEENRRGTTREGEVTELLSMVGLPPSYATRRPSALSGGERQRAAIARAVAVRPRLLICDEPVAALDVSVQAQVLELLRSIRAETGMSMLFITHDLAVVRQMTERTIVLYKGEIVESGSTSSILDVPTHAYTQRLLNSVPASVPGNTPESREHNPDLVRSRSR